jgi:hypothetical protein
MRDCDMKTMVDLGHSRRFVLAILVCCLTASAQNAPMEPNYVQKYKALEKGKELIRQCGNDEFLSLDFASIPRRIKAQMYSYLAFSLTWDGHPQARDQVEKCENTVFRVYAASSPNEDDLVEYRWRFMNQGIRAIASLNAFRLDIDLDELSSNASLDQFGQTRLGRAKGLVSRLLKLEGQDRYREDFKINIPWPATLGNGVAFCTNPDQSIIVLMRWHRRLDFYVENGVLSILIYKKIPQLAFWQDGSKWFKDDFRALVHSKAKSGK